VRVLGEWRRRAGLTQVELATRAGLTQAYISRLESTGTPTVETLGKLAAVLEPSNAELADAVRALRAEAPPTSLPPESEVSLG